jgi:DNA polymerase-3 subunit beta
MLTFERDKLSDCMDRAAKIASRRSPRELTKWVLIEAADGKAVITATDCEVGIRMTCPCEGPPLTTLVPGPLVAGFLRSMTGEEVTLELDSDKAVLSDKSATFRPPVRDPQEFVGWTTPENSVSLDASKFNPAVRRTAWAADEESTRYALGGVLMEFKGGELALAATDSRALAVETLDVDTEIEWKGIVPTVAIVPAAQLMGGTFTFHYGEKAVEFAGIDSSYYSRLVEGRFPKYQDVIPKGKFPCEIVLACGDLVRLVSQAMLVTVPETRGVDFSISDRTLWATVGSNEEKGGFKARLPVAFDGEIGTTLDPQFPREFLSKLEPDAKLHWGIAAETANLFTVEGLNWQCVVMPLARE